VNLIEGVCSCRVFLGGYDEGPGFPNGELINAFVFILFHQEVKELSWTVDTMSFETK
jgi:hypothetical protein